MGNLLDRMYRFFNGLDLEPDGSLPVTLQDSTSPIVILPLNKVENETTLSVAAAYDDYTITVTDTTGFVDGAFLGIVDAENETYWFGHQVGAVVGNVVTVDRPVNAAYAIGTGVFQGTNNMAVNGSVTPQIFSVRAAAPTLPLSLDITRIIITMFTATAADLSTFGDIAGGITNGITLRHVTDTPRNVFNVKTNGEIGGIAYDLQLYTALGQGQEGVTARLTFASSGKMGAVIRIGPGEDLQCIIRDNLSTLTKFNIVAEGSGVVL